MFDEIEENDHEDLLRHMAKDMTVKELKDMLKVYEKQKEHAMAQIIKDELIARQ